MLPFPNPLVGGGAGIVYVGQASSASATTLSFPVGAKAGDFAVVLSVDTSTISGWTTDTVGIAAAHRKLLTASDISSPPSIASATNWGVLVYTGPNTSVVKSTTTDAVNPYEFAGFNKDGGRGLVSLIRSQNVSPSPPAGWTSRLAAAASDGFTTINAADLFDLSQYANGSTLSWSGTGAGTIIVAGFVLELI